MKGGSQYKLRIKRFLSLTALVCLTFAVWAWEKTALLSTFLPSSDQYEMSSSMSSPVFSLSTPQMHSVYTNQKPSIEDVPFDASIEEVPSQPATEDKFSNNIKSPPLRGSEESLFEEKKESDNLKMVTSNNKECNYAKGKWVADRRRPLYSGLGCKQWLSEMWSCRSNNRTDFSYERYRWQPKDCEMPEFEGSKFLKQVQHKTIAFVGDSLGRQQFQSLMCMVTGGQEHPEVEDISIQYGLDIQPGSDRPSGWAFRFPTTNTTILYYWSASLCAIEPINITDPNTNFAMHLDRPAQFLQQYLHRFNVLVLNTGHHWNRGKVNANRWVMYINGKPNTDRKTAMIWIAKDVAVHSVAKWIDSQMPKHSELKVFFRTISPRHFLNGDWNTGGSCDNTKPLVGGSEVTQNVSADPVVEDAVKGTRVKILDITALSQLRDEAHVSKYSIRATPGSYDCLHWCLPGIPDTWNEILAAQV
ncbi:uncharacterized protein A4U43_C03F21810 [Asparagus officinalis]|uniref:Uncharacterized protein n=1 Tax=Asparagus officinalis TaxID=4686 RepID=A0A5P1FBY7_ASPOF|nr:protein trichome birefringence-like 14 [Asparagus officinalis]ONK75906.1 uncharacterized protein A4U43_C03F21810 [Asparagus officinalis]